MNTTTKPVATILISQSNLWSRDKVSGVKSSRRSGRDSARLPKQGGASRKGVIAWNPSGSMSF